MSALCRSTNAAVFCILTTHFLSPCFAAAAARSSFFDWRAREGETAVEGDLEEKRRLRKDRIRTGSEKEQRETNTSVRRGRPPVSAEFQGEGR